MVDVAQVQIVNTALGLLGQEPVTDLSEASLQASISATKLMRHIEQARDTVLRRHGWLCALEYATLAPAMPEGYSNWRYPTVYYLPSDALRTWEIAGICPGGNAGFTCDGPFFGDGWEPRWQTGTFETDDGARQIIRAQNADASLNIVYVRRCDWSSLDAHVADAIAFETASRAGFSITGASAVMKDMAQRAEAKVMMAISVDGTQEGGQPPWAPSIPQALRNLSR